MKFSNVTATVNGVDYPGFFALTVEEIRIMNYRNTIIPEKIKRLPLLALACPLFFAACDLLPSPAEPSAAGANTLVIRIGGAITDGRTALPPAVAMYRITVTPRRGNNRPDGLGELFQPEETTVNADAGSYSILLSRTPEEGDVVLVEAYADIGMTNKIAEASATLTPDNITSEGAAVVVITLAFSSEGTGEVNLSVSVPTSFPGDDEITAAEVSLYQSLADYQKGGVYQFTRYRKDSDYGAGGNLGSNIPIEFKKLPSGNYVVKIDFFRKFVRVSRLVQTIIVRDELETNRWDNGNNNLIWGEDKYASSNANLAGADGIKIGGGAVPDYNPATYTYAIYKDAPSSGTAETPLLTIVGEPGQQIKATLNGNDVANGGALPLELGANSLVIAVTAPDGVTKQTYTVSYTYHHATEWYVLASGSDSTGDGTVSSPFATVEKALEAIVAAYQGGSGWPGGASEPVTARINIAGEIIESVTIENTSTKPLPPILFMGSESEPGPHKIKAASSKRVITIGDNTSVILGGDLTLTGGNVPTNGGGVYVSGGSFTMNGGTVSENSANPQTGGYGGGVYVGSGSFTMNGGTVSDNKTQSAEGDGYGGGVYVGDGSFTMNGGTISGNTINNGNNGNGGGVYVSGGSFTMNGGTVSENETEGGNGGGVHVRSDNFTMNGGTVSGNTASNGKGGGMYVGSGNFTMSGGTISDNKATSSGNSAESHGGGVYFNSSSGSFTMSGGTISENSTTRYGGGVYFSGGGDFNMYEGTISGNSAITTDSSDAKGGGVYLSGGTFTMEGGSVSGNSDDGNGGGGVFVSGGTFTMEGGSVSGNTDTSGYGGGGVVVNNGATFTMRGGSVSGNSTIAGGGVFVSDENTKFEMRGGSVSGNTASYGGGGVSAGNYGTFTMSGGTVSGNNAPKGGGASVGSYGTFTMSGGSVSGNNATNNGGGVFVDALATFTMSGGSVSGNNATNNGGGVFVDAGATFTMSGGSVSGNNATNNGGGVFVTAYGKFTMEKGTISGNNATNNGGGVFVPYVSSSYLNTYPPITMSKDAAIHIDNPVYLEDGGVIILSGTLTTNPAANIEYPTDSGTQVLADDTNTTENDITTGDNYTKFLLKDASDMIDEYGKIK